MEGRSERKRRLEQIIFDPALTSFHFLSLHTSGSSCFVGELEIMRQTGDHGGEIKSVLHPAIIIRTPQSQVNTHICTTFSYLNSAYGTVLQICNWPSKTPYVHTTSSSPLLGTLLHIPELLPYHHAIIGPT